MKKLLAVLLIVLMVTTGCSSVKTYVKEGYLTVGISPDYAPYEFYNGSEVVGSDVEFAKYLADGLGVKIEFVVMEFESILENVKMGKIDIGISGFTYEAEREANFNLTKVYSLDGEGSQGILIKKSDLELYGSFSKLNNSNVKIAAQNGSLQHKLVREQLANAKLETIKNIPDSIPFLLNGNYHAFAVAEVIAKQIIANNPSLMFIDEKFVTDSSSLIAVINKKNKTLLDKVNELITAMDEDLYLKWFNEAHELAMSLGEV